MRRRPMQALRPVGTRISLGLIRSAALVATLLGTFLIPGAAADPLPITYTIDGIKGTNSWYRGSTGGNYVVLHWTVNVPAVDTTGCEYAVKLAGPTTGTTRTCTVTLGDGTKFSATTAPIKIDADPPAGVKAAIARGPDFNGWYNHPVAVSWSGSDATSGIAACTVLTYAGPASAAARPSGGCTDKAGNGSSSAVSLSYDATAPVLSKVAVTSGAASDIVRWASSSESDAVVVQRAARGKKEQTVVFRGTGTRFADRKIQPGVEYVYAVQSADQAGNASRKLTAVGLPKVLTLRRTPYVPRAAGRPILRWQPARGATYYHVQLFRGSKRILAAWPSGRELALPASWTWAGHKYRLRPARYRWYVWAGLGRRSFAHYRAMGSSRFIVPR
jgi:hypothetical protein